MSNRRPNQHRTCPNQHRTCRNKTGVLRLRRLLIKIHSQRAKALHAALSIHVVRAQHDSHSTTMSAAQGPAKHPYNGARHAPSSPQLSSLPPPTKSNRQSTPLRIPVHEPLAVVAHHVAKPPLCCETVQSLAAAAGLQLVPSQPPRVQMLSGRATPA